jgi:hypothetical protein
MRSRENLVDDLMGKVSLRDLFAIDFMKRELLLEVFGFVGQRDGRSVLVHDDICIGGNIPEAD